MQIGDSDARTVVWLDRNGVSGDLADRFIQEMAEVGNRGHVYMKRVPAWKEEDEIPF